LVLGVLNEILRFVPPYDVGCGRHLRDLLVVPSGAVGLS
jgi:hypothetical protein